MFYALTFVSGNSPVPTGAAPQKIPAHEITKARKSGQFKGFKVFETREDCEKYIEAREPIWEQLQEKYEQLEPIDLGECK